MTTPVAPVRADCDRGTRPRLYLAGPMGDSNGLHHRVLNALDVARDLTKIGYAVFVPHLSFYRNILHPDEHTYEDWMDDDFTWIRACDVLYRMEGLSPGADREVAFAAVLNIPVIRSLEEARRRYGSSDRRFVLTEQLYKIDGRVTAIMEQITTSSPIYTIALSIRDILADTLKGRSNG